jgi:hypothetical protein
VDPVQRRMLVRSRKSAAQTLAVSMHSSIRRCASLRVRGTICSILPCALQTIGLGGVEVDRATGTARLEQDLEQLVQVLQVRHQLRALVRLGPLVFDSTDQTSL